MSVIRETQNRSDPQQNYSLDPTKISIGAAGGLAETSGTIPEPSPIIQPGFDEGNRKQRALEALEGIGEIGSNIPQRPENLRTYNPPLPDEPLNIPEIGTQFVSNIGDAMGKGVVNPPLYNAQKGGSRFDNLLGVQRQRPPSDNPDIFGPPRQVATDEGKPIEIVDPITGSRTFKKVSNLLGKSPILGPFGGNFVSGFGGIINGTQQLTNQLLRGDLTAEEKVSESFKVMEALSAEWLQSLKIAESLGFDPDAIDRRAWGYKEFEDGTVFNPLGNIPVMQKAFMKDPLGFVGNLAVASAENPLGAIATLGAGSEWGEAGPGAFGMAMYALTNITSLPIAAVQDLHTLVKEGNLYSTTLNGKFLRSLQGRDYSFTSAQRVLPDGTVDNRLSLWAQQQEEPKTWEDWAKRNWIAAGYINTGDYVRKALTGESGLDNPVSFFGIKPPKNMIGLSEFAVGMVLDGGVDFASASAFTKLQDVHASNKAFNSAVKGAPTPFDSLEVLQARQTRNSKRIRQLQNRFVKNGGLNAADTDELRNLNIMAQENQRLVDRVSDWGSPLEVPTDLTPRGVVKELARSDELIEETENIQRVTSAGGIDAKAPGQDIAPQKPVDGFVVRDDGTIDFAYDPKATPRPKGVTLNSVDTGFSTNQADDILVSLPDGTSVAKGPTNFDPATGMFKRNTGAVMEGIPPTGQAAVLPPRPNFEQLETTVVNNPTASAKIEQAKQHFIRLEADDLEESTVIEPTVLGGEFRVVDIIPEEENTIIEVAASPDGLIRGRVREKLQARQLRQQRDLPGVPERAALPEGQVAEPLEPTIATAQALPQREVIAQAVETAKRTTNIEDFVDDAGRIKVEEITQVIEDLSDSQINVMETFNRARADLVNLRTQPIKGAEVIGVPTPASIKNIQDTSRYLAVKEQIFNSYFAQNSKEVSAAITRGQRFITELQQKIFAAEEALGKLDPASDAAGELLDRLATLEDLADDIQKNIDFLGAKSQTGQRGRLSRLRAAYRKGKIPEPEGVTPRAPEPLEPTIAAADDLAIQNLEHTQSELESVISNLQEAYVALPPGPQRKLLEAAIDETVGEHKKIQSQINRTRLGDVTSDGFSRNIEFEYDPNDYRSASSPFNEAEDPAQVYVPWVEADGKIHRTPISEFRAGNLGTAEVRPEMMDAYPFENVVGDLASQPDNYVENFYSHLVKKVTQMEAMYTEEAAKFQKLLEKIPTTSWKRKPIQKNLPQQATTTLPDQFADRVAKNKVINNADGLGDGVQPVYHGTRGRDIALTSDPVEVSASGPMGVGTYLTTDPENAVNYARSMGVPNRPNVDGTQFNANVGSVFRVTINSDRILDARKAIPKAVKAELKNVLADTTSQQFKTLLGNNAGGDQLAIALGKAIDNANNHKQLIDQIDIAIDVWARQTLGTANLPEEIVLQTQRAVALTYRSFGIDAVQITKKLKGYVDPITEIAVINPQVMRATAVQDMKVPSPVRQAAHRSNAEVITNKIYGTKRTSDAAVEAKMKLASQRSHETGKRYKKLTEQLNEVGSVRADRKIQQEIDRVDAFYKKFDADENLFGAVNERIRARNASRTVPNQLKTQADFEDLPYKLNPDGSPKIDFKDFNEFLKKQKDKGIKISDEIEDRMRRLYTEYVTNQAATQTTQQAMAQKEKIIQGIVDTAFSQHITDMVNLNETSIGRFQQWMAMLFDYKWQALNPRVLSEAGFVRDALAKASNVANGLIEQYARFQIAPLVDEFMKIGKAHLKPKVGHKLDFRRLMMDVLEIGAFEKLNAQARLMPEARALQKAKYDKLIDELKQFVDEPVIESLLDFSRRISASADEVRMVANAVGLNLGRVQGIGYVERVLDPDVLRWWRATERKTKAKAFSRFVDDSAKRLDVNVQKSRGSFVFVPEDVDVLATLLKKDRDELMAMMDNNELYDYLRAQDSAVTQALEDFGILSKVHLSNREATEFLLEQFGDNLPELINKELFLTNPEDAFKQYANSLREQVQRSGVFKLLFGQGTKNGWIVPSSVYDALPANAAEAKRIQDIGIPELFGGVSGKLSKDDFVELPASVIEKWAPAYKAEGTVFVHKTVNNQMNSMVNLFGHPESANVVFQAAYSLSRFWNEAMLLGKTGWYTTNIAIDSIKQAFAAGTDLMQFPKAMNVITRGILRGDLSGLNDTRKVFASFGGKLVTEKQMTLDFLQMWGKNLAPQALQDIEGGRNLRNLQKMLNPIRGARWYTNFIQSFGPTEALGAVLQDARALQATVFSKFFGKTAAHAEMIARYAAYRTWMDRSPAKLQNKIGLTAKKFAHYYTAEEITDPNKAWRHMEDYFTNWDTVGKVPGMVGLLRPFLSYGMWNSPSQVRQFIKNPLGYRNQARMMYYMNQRLFAKEDMNESSIPTWMSDSYYTGYDIEGTPMMLLPHGFDTRFDAITSLEKTEQRFLADQNILTGSTKEKLEQMQREVDDVTLFRQLLDKSPITKTLVELSTGETLDNVPVVDPITGRGPLTGMPWQAEHLLMAYPPLKAIVKTNPGNILGRPEIRDSETGQVIAPGVPGLIGGHIPVERGSNLDKYLRNPETATNFEKGMRLLARIGGPVRFIDRASNMRMTMRQMNRLLRDTTKQKAELEAKYDKMLKDGRDKTSPKIFKETETKLRRMIWFRMNLQKDMTVMNLYFKANNLATDKDIIAIDKLELENFVRENGSPIYEEFVEKSIDDLNLLIELVPEEFN